MPPRLWLALPVSLALMVTGAGARPAEAPPGVRWTDATPDAMINDAAARALSPGATEHAQVAAMATVAELAERAGDGHARDVLERIAAAPGFAADLRADAALLARTLAPDEGTDEGGRLDGSLGVAESLLILGPFRDNGGGLDARDGPEAAGAAFDPSARYSWGSFEVEWRAVPPQFATARGVPLDLFVFPRRESCTWIATTLIVERARSITVRVAASGQVRVVFDGVDVARDEAVHGSARFDRIAARVDAGSGEHLLAAKVCSGALDDDGRVRLRVADDAGRWPDGVRAMARPDRKAPPTTGRPVTRAVSTPLARATTLARPAGPNLRADGEVDALLDAAIIRTLGGADDLRSPRAPGSLAALESTSLDSDRRAMAAWVTPNGANRGASLNRARAGADAATRAFIDRRLVERHLEAQLSDWASAWLEGTTIDAASDPEAALLAARVDLALGTDALRVRAMRRLAAAADAAPRTVPDAMLDLLAHVAEGLDPEVARSARERLGARGRVDADLVRVVASTEGRAGAVRAALLAFASGRLEDADDAIAVAQTVARTGDHPQALALYRQLAAWAPNRAAVWAGLAREVGSSEAAPDDRDRVLLSALRRARELDPGEARYRVELALRTRAPTLDTEARDDEKYLVASADILARRVGVAGPAAAPAGGNDATARAPAATSSGPAPDGGGQPPDVADRELHWLRAVVMHPDRRVSEMVHYAREIVIAPRTEDELYEDVPAEGDLTEILRARVHRKDGATAFPLEEANESAHPRIRWPELSAGDVVEVAFRSWTAGPVGGRGDPPFFRLDYAGALSTHPVLHNEVIVESPGANPIFVDVVNGKADARVEKDEVGRHIVRLVWSKPRNVPDEPLAPPLSEIVPTVVLSTFHDWSAFRAWYGEAVRGFTEPDAEVRELATALTKGKVSRDDKVRALFDFVADDIRYVNFVSGEWWLPNRPQQLLARREGDCDDKALLLITLLRAVGIDAQEVMVQTRLTGQPSILRAPGAAIPLFDHGIAFLQGASGGWYLDATSPQSRLGPLPSMDARALALRMDGPAEIVELPASSPDDHGIDATWTLRLTPDGAASIDGEERATGDDAFWMRTSLTEPGARAQWVEDRLIGTWFSTIQVDKDVEFRGDLPRGAATVHWHGRSAGLARHEGSELVVALSSAQTIASQLAPLVKRTLPVWLPPHIAPRKEARRIRLVAPRGWTFEALPPGGEEDGGRFGRAHLEVGRDPRDPQTILVQRTVVFDQGVISRDEYPRWRAWVQRIDALMHKVVRLIPVRTAP